MPHPRILQVLGMSPSQWGGLPPEMGSIVGPGIQCTNERRELREKAMKLIAEEDAKAAQAKSNGGEQLNKRLDNIEASIRGVANDINLKFDSFDTRLKTMERGYDITTKQLGSLLEAEAKRSQTTA